MKKSIFITLLFIFSFSLISKHSYAVHFVGGEITWKCKSNGKFVFYLQVYRECTAAPFGNSINIQSNSPAGSINLVLEAGYPKDLSPVCNPDTSFDHISCGTATIQNTGAVSVYRYKSTEIILNGTPPSFGWNFYWQSTSRAIATNITGMPDWYLRATMYPYGNANYYPCFDSSPDFAAPPTTVVPSGFNSIVSFSAHDLDHNYIEHEFTQAYQINGSPLPYANGYTYLSPLPSALQNVNNTPATIDTATGLISFTSYTPGSYLAKVKVTSYKNGIKIAEVCRENNIIIVSDTNDSPVFGLLPANSLQIIRDTIGINDTISYSISASDYSFLPNNTPQSVFLEAYSPQFGSFIPGSTPNQGTLSDSVGCLSPPCATLTPAWDSVPLNGSWFVSTQLKWNTTSAHMKNGSNSGGNSRLYNFLFRVRDDYCPVPAERSFVLSLLLKSKNIYQNANIHCVSTYTNGDVLLRYSPVSDPDSTFLSYHIMSSVSKTGPYILLDSILNKNIGQYSHIGAGADTLRRYYLVKVNSYSSTDNYYHSQVSDTISTINIVVSKANLCTNEITWNAPFDKKRSSTASNYEVSRRVPNGPWNIIGSPTTTSFSDVAKLLGDTVYYKVTLLDNNLSDSTGPGNYCLSVSNETMIVQPSITFPEVVMRSVDKNINGDVYLIWNRFIDTQNRFANYTILHSSTLNGTYVTIGTVPNIFKNTFTHIGANADTNSCFYRIIVSIKDCDNQLIELADVDTVRPMLLKTSITSTDNIHLTWNSIRDTPIPTTTNMFYIYSRLITSNWSLVDSTSNQYYSTTLKSMRSYYRISIEDFDISQSIAFAPSYSNQTEMLCMDVEDQENRQFKLNQNIPNPFNDFSTIVFYSSKNQVFEFTIFDSQGKLISIKKINAVAGENSIELNREGLGAGIYYYQLNNSEFKSTKKFIVE